MVKENCPLEVESGLFRACCLAGGLLDLFLGVLATMVTASVCWSVALLCVTVCCSTCFRKKKRQASSQCCLHPPPRTLLELGESPTSQLLLHSGAVPHVPCLLMYELTASMLTLASR